MSWPAGGTVADMTLEALLRTVATHLAAVYAGLLLAANLAVLANFGPVTTCHFDGGGTSVTGSVTETTDSRLWLCTDDGQLVPWHGQVPDVRNIP